MVDMKDVFRNIVQQLQLEPRRYKLFGIYWWPIKALLKASGYTTDNLYMLGGYQDEMTASLVPKMSLQDTITAALEEYGQNAVFPHPDGAVEDPNGEMVVVFDEDAGL